MPIHSPLLLWQPPHGRGGVKIESEYVLELKTLNLNN
jgi:hypothetical protein